MSAKKTDRIDAHLSYLVKATVIIIFLTAAALVVYFTKRSQDPVLKLTDVALKEQVISLFDDKTNEMIQSKLTTAQAESTTKYKQELLTQAELDAMIAAVPFKMQRAQQIRDGVTVTSFVLVFVVAGVGAVVMVRKYEFVIYQIGEFSKIPVHRNVAKKEEMGMIVAGLVSAEQMKAQNPAEALAMMKQAGQLALQVAGRTKITVNTLKNITPALPEAPSVITQAHIPTFADLLNTHEIGQGKPLIFGYHGDQPHTGGWEDLYSCAVGGIARSGKSSTLRSLICQSVLQGCEFWLIDPHASHPKGLKLSLEPLINTGVIKYGLPLDIISEVNLEMNLRLKQTEPQRPKILVVDEYLQAVKIPGLSDLIIRFGTETAKAELFCMVAGHSWQAEHTGKTTIVRDNLASKFVHKMIPKQANVLLQNPTLSHQVSDLLPGQALFCPVADQPLIVNVPFCTASDVERVAGMLPAMQTTPATGKETPVIVSKETGIIPFEDFGHTLFVAKVNELRSRGIFQKQLAADCDIKESHFSKILTEPKRFPGTRRKIYTGMQAYLTRG